NKAGKVNRKQEREVSQRLVESLQIKLPSAESDVENLSGGNQQKVVIGKWLARNSRVIIFDEPTRGVDVGAKVEIYNLMNRLKQEKTGVLFVSSELPEIMGISDRILVMCDGKITGEMSAEDATEDKIMACATAFETKI
ncbi:MAG: ATP-binding cassette domain-containing protein, partial [Pseudoflavonifractor sp.]